VTSLRRRNLALGFSILALLGSAIAALSLAVRRAHALAEQQRQFMASMSHELRTPLAVIGSAAENLRDGTVDEGLRVREYGTMIHTESRRLGAMLDHALRLAAGRDLRDELRLQPVDVHAVVDTAIASFAQELRTRGGQIERDLPGDEDSDAATLTADPEALRQAIENVVGNALKYGGEPPWLAVRVSRVITAAGPAIEIAVEDRGMGIPPDEVGHVFEPFFRGREPLARQIRGTGLGLALVARVVQAHDGTVSVDSAAGRGSVFRLRLPCTAVDRRRA
jgi:signal transduction histidine kinase